MPKKISSQSQLPISSIASKIYSIRGKRIMLNIDLSVLYDVPTKRLNEAVKRNEKRFPKDFMFKLTTEEVRILRSQFATLPETHFRYQPHAFTEHGILMLSSVLNSERAITVNIHIMRTFTKLREMISTHKDLCQKITELESKVGKHDEQIQVIIRTIRELLKPPEPPKKRPIGFHV